MAKSAKGRLGALKVAVSATALGIAAGFGLVGQAQADSAASHSTAAPGAETAHAGTELQPYLDIVTNHEVPPGPGGNPALGSDYASSPFVLDPAGINGVGQQIVFQQTGPAAAGLLLCTGTLINPRTVITAAHCVYNNPAYMYGSNTGTGGGVNGAFGTGGAIVTSQGIPISFGFSSTNRCIAPNAAYPTGNGCAVGTGPYEHWRDSSFQTQTGLAIYNGNQVWYGRGSQPVALGGGGEFANEDIALVTLDTHANDIPTWTLLFSQLDGPTHSIITGYGNAGVGIPGIGDAAGIDYRRRSAENMIDALFNQRDWGETSQIGFPPGGLAGNEHSIYWNDFDDPDFNNIYNPATWCIDTSGPARNNAYCDQNGLGGVTLPREGSTAGGDSGGPLIVDQRFDRPVVAGVLTGTWSATGIVSYGQWNVYPPLFQFWQEIVANNPYIYAGSRPGNADWTNPAHWVQLMDPNYAIIGSDGQLHTSLPSTPQGGADGDVDKFGAVCFFGDCVDYTETYTPEPGGPYLVIPGGPGSKNFVPNNVEPVNSANAALNVRARYYDVTLSAIGETRVTTPITIDRFTLDGLLTSLDVRSSGTLNVWSDFNAYRGFLNIDGRVNSGEALLLQGVLTGHGTFNPTFLTSVDGIIAPGSLSGVGTLTVQGNVVLASENELLIELGKTTNDLLRITADPAQGTTGSISLGGDLWLTPAPGAAPRDKQVFTVVRADGAVLNTFDDVNGFLGILRPTVTYTAHTVDVKLKAGSFLDIFLHAPELAPFALALDALREHHYDNLYDLYGRIDLMDVNSLTNTFSAFRPNSLLDARGLLAMQDLGFTSTLDGRIAMLSRSNAAPLGLSIMGSPEQVLSFSGDAGLGNHADLSFATMMTQSRSIGGLPRGMSAFVTGGYQDSRASAIAGHAALSTDDSMQSWNFAGGVEQSFGSFTLGIAAMYSHGNAMQTGFGALAENDLSQSAAYGVYRFGNGAYIAGLVGAGISETSTDRQALQYRLHGETGGRIFIASVEGGMNFDVMSGLVFTPNISLRQTNVLVNGYTENGGEAALALDDMHSDRLEGRAGARLSGNFSFGDWTLTPDLGASVVANLSGNEDGAWAHFAAAPDVPFYLTGSERDDLWGEFVGGLQLTHDQTSMSLRMESSVAREELHENRIVARFAHQF